LLAVLVLSAVGVNGQDSIKTYLDNGVDLMAKQDYQGALSAYQNALRLDPDNYLAIRNIGVNYAHLKDQKQAMAYLERAYKMDPTDAQVCNNLAVVFTSLGNSSEALRYLELAVAIDSTNDKYLTNLGQEYSRIGRIGKALPLLLRAWTINQKNAIIPYYIGNCFGATNAYDSAEYYYNQSVSLGGRPPELYYRLGTVQNRLGKTLEASESFVEALKRNPNFKECRQSLAMLFMTDRQYTAAGKEFEILCNADSSFYPAWIGYGTALAMDGRGEESEQILSRLFAIDSALGFQMLKVISLQK
jgi:tetratricopeptide (TPR) repeat protein